MITINEVSLALEEDESSLKSLAAAKLHINEKLIKDVKIVRRSVDARRKADIRLKYALEVELFDAALKKKADGVQSNEPEQLYRGNVPLNYRPVIVGAGPCGMFAALVLSEAGYFPVIYERGESADKREKRVNALLSAGVFDAESNICFGEGGAGAFSDGKLTTRIKDAQVRQVLQTLVRFGAPADILIDTKPHLGTENIRAVFKNIRIHCETLGASFHFETKVKDLQSGEPSTVITQNGKTRAQVIVMAVGGSARDTFEMLLKKTAISPKPFAVGVRIEHERSFIDDAQFGGFASHPKLGAADYHLSTQANGRGVYTFCMCPGGMVINSSCEAEASSVNGMSFYTRNAVNSNSAVVVQVFPSDFGTDALSGVTFQRKYERLCYEIAGYGAPVMTVGDFFGGHDGILNIRPSINNYVYCDIRQLLPDFVTAALANGIKSFGRVLKGFDMPEAVLTAIETKTSSPLRMKRNADCESESFKGLYLGGEGAGWAGGIMSSAVDGLKIASNIITKYKAEF